MSENSLLKFVSYKTFTDWSAKSYLAISEIQSIFSLELLGNLIEPRKIKVRKNEYKGDLDIVKKISFNDGVIHIRDERKTGMDMYEVFSNDLLVSKINFHQGALAVNNTGQKILSSTHYQPYMINRDKVLDKYLVMIIRTEHFKNYLAYVKSEGIKTEATYELLKNLQIPLPPIKVQKQIVQAYEDKINLANQLEQRAEKLETKIEKYLYAKLGIEQAQEQKQGKKGVLKFVRFEKFQRWDTDFFKQKEGYSSKYEAVSYGELFVSLNNGIAARNYASDGIRYLKVSDIRDNYINNDKPFYVNKYKESDLIEKGTLLITRKGTVGNSYYLDKEGLFVASSEIFIIKLNDKVKGNYLSEINLSSFVKRQYREKSTGTIMPSLSQPKLKSILIPLPPLEIQNHIAMRIQKLKDYIKILKQQAEQNREDALKNFEAEIFSKE